MEKHIDIWNKAKNEIRQMVDYIKQRNKKELKDLEELQEEIEEIRGRLGNMEPDDRMSERERMNYLILRRSRLERSNESILSYISSPYFAKLTCDEAYYITRHKSLPEKNLFSFTSPIAKLRYSDLDKPVKVNSETYEVKQIQEYKIDNSRLFWLEHKEPGLRFSYDGEKLIKRDILVEDINVQKPQKAKVIQESTHEEPRTNRNPKLTSIVELMKKEQDEVMRAPEKGVTLITGSAGSGKTNIAIHRIRYLLNEFPLLFSEENIGIFCYNVALKNYLDNLISELKLENCNIYSYDQWLSNVIKAQTNITYIDYLNEKREVQYLMTRKEVIGIIKGFLQSKKDTILKYIAEDEVLSQYRDFFNSHKKDVITISDIVSFSKWITTKSNNLQDKRESVRDKDQNSIVNVIKNLFLRNENIHSTNPTPGNSQNATVESIKQRLADILIREYCVTWEWDNKTYKIDGVRLLNQLYASDNYITYMNSHGLNYRHIADTSTSVDQSDSYLVGLMMSFIARNLFRETGKQFDNIVVDEAQDFAPIQIKTLYNLCNDSFTIAGDATQRIYDNGITSWDEAGVEIDHKYELNMSHRATLETVLFAKQIIGGGDIAKTVGRQGEKPLVVCCNSPMRQVIDQVKEIRKKDAEATIAVVYPTKTMINETVRVLNNNGINAYRAMRDEWRFTPDVAVSTYYQTKGLEFDYIIIMGVSDFENSNFFRNKKNLLYTVITRAKERVIIICRKFLPNCIERVDSNLYDHSSVL
ncbi:MAG: UvrD-helicase domain-containing protein [Caldicoprobacterales bacterium]